MCSIATGNYLRKTLNNQQLIMNNNPSNSSNSISSNSVNSKESPAQPQKKSNKCFIDHCLDRVAKIVGDCRYCSHAYCGKHRLPESHACEKISNCRQESYDRNSDKLLNGKCVADKL